MGPYSPYKYLYGFVLALSVLVSVLTAIGMIADFQAGTILESERIAGFLTGATLIPMFMYFLHLSRSRPAALQEAVAGRVFEHTATDRATSAILIWGLGIGMMVSSFLTTQQASGPTSSDQWYLWISALMCLLSLCCFVLSLTGIWMYRLVLSKDGILFSKVKGGLIRWQDVQDIRFDRKLGFRRIAVDVVDPAKYGLKRSWIIIRPAYFNAGPDEMMAVFLQERPAGLS
jgi:hypothetical protein